MTADVARRQAAEAEREIGARSLPRAAPRHSLRAEGHPGHQGITTTNGSKVTATVVPDYESTITDRLAQAGAVLAGKLNLLEFAMGSGVVSGFGPARNPWDLARSPSGSSSGSGAALAAAMVPLSIGTDTGGSIRGPANFCGIVGLKQTYGRVSRHGVTTLAWTLDHAGPMTRTVADAASMLQAIAGHDPLDPTTTTDPVPDYSQRAHRRHPRHADRRADARSSTDGLAPEIETARIARRSTHAEGLGATLVDVDVPARRVRDHRRLGHRDGRGRGVPRAAAAHVARALRPDRARAARRGAVLHGDRLHQGAARAHAAACRRWPTVFTPCDVMAVPGGGALPPLLEPPELAGTDVKPGSTASRFRGGTTFLGNMTGLPALMLPCGFSAGPPALPIGLQLYGRAFDEATLFRVGHAYEQATELAHAGRPPLA